MRIIIIGPTLLTRHCLEQLAEDPVRRGDDQIVAVYALEDRLAAGKARFALMDDLAERYSIPLFKVSDINSPSVVSQLRSLEPDVIFELGWSQIISPEVLSIPPKGTIGVHASLLPKNRGAASLNWSLINGEQRTGVSLFYLAEKPDDGDIIAQKSFDIDERDDIATLHLKSDLVSAELLLENLDAIRSGVVRRIKQNPDEVTLTKRRRPDDGVINWSLPSASIYNWIRAQAHPFPGAFTFWKGKKLYVWSVEPVNAASPKPAGTVCSVERKKGVLVSSGSGLLLLKRVQPEGGAEMWADDFAGKFCLREGDVLGS